MSMSILTGLQQQAQWIALVLAVAALLGAVWAVSDWFVGLIVTGRRLRVYRASQSLRDIAPSWPAFDQPAAKGFDRTAEDRRVIAALVATEERQQLRLRRRTS